MSLPEDPLPPAGEEGKSVIRQPIPRAKPWPWGILTSGLLLLSLGCARETDEARIGRAIHEIVQAIEAKESGKAVGHLAEDYRDFEGRTPAETRGFLLLHFRRNPKIRIYIPSPGRRRRREDGNRQIERRGRRSGGHRPGAGAGLSRDLPMGEAGRRVESRFRRVDARAGRKPAGNQSMREGRTSAARPERWTSTIHVFGVGSRLASMTNAPARLAVDTNEAAGWTIPDVPTTRKTSHDSAASKAARMSSGSSDSPNQTMWGRRSPPHVSQ